MTEGSERRETDEGARGAAATERWLTRRVPGVPAEFLPWLREHGSVPGPEGPDDAEGAGDVGGADADLRAVGRALEARGVDALRRALAAPGRVRESAFRLLAADAYLTWGAEALLELDDPDEALADLVGRLAREDR